MTKHKKLAIWREDRASVFFFEITQYNARTLKTLMNTRTQNPTPMIMLEAHLKITFENHIISLQP